MCVRERVHINGSERVFIAIINWIFAASFLAAAAKPVTFKMRLTHDRGFDNEINKQKRVTCFCHYSELIVSKKKVYFTNNHSTNTCLRRRKVITKSLKNQARKYVNNCRLRSFFCPLTSETINYPIVPKTYKVRVGKGNRCGFWHFY